MTINDYALWRGLHVLGVVLWIGGVAFVTTILIPALRRSGNDYALFEKLEHRFGLQAKLSTQIVLISGLAMLYLSNAWSRLADTWWLWAMIVTWGIFTLMLFVLEPWLIHGWLKRKAQLDSAATMRLLQRLHYALLALSLLTVGAGVVGAHGGAWF
ncbi:hypothetical protein HQN60_05540 [Deefgea piscis]|uniref:Copper resistance protein D domain-containing protein n=1 Tax=Deefgea piscis TaxID=2739061 RepID=A0A6M8STT5_9NEIS|nr:hypothetical protein [Deefgea piscis]QKJ66219.1 hypothetical protein HQN60_05540 [Deefgea piscis]